MFSFYQFLKTENRLSYFQNQTAIECFLNSNQIQSFKSFTCRLRALIQVLSIFFFLHLILTSDCNSLKVPRNLRLTYIHAYQSFLWNTVVSKRVAKFGLEPVIGDLVLAHEEEVCDPAESNVTEKVEEAECPPEGENGEEASGLIQRIKKKVILLDENNLSDYTIYDVVLPLPGFDVLYPTNEAGEWYTELLQADGLADSGFKQSVK